MSRTTKKTKKPTNLTLDPETRRRGRKLAAMEKHSLSRMVEGLIDREAKRLGVAA
jgi:hypothetical protein